MVDTISILSLLYLRESPRCFLGVLIAIDVDLQRRAGVLRAVAIIPVELGTGKVGATETMQSGRSQPSNKNTRYNTYLYTHMIFPLPSRFPSLLPYLNLFGPASQIAPSPKYASTAQRLSQSLIMPCGQKSETGTAVSSGSIIA